MRAGPARLCWATLLVLLLAASAAWGLSVELEPGQLTCLTHETQPNPHIQQTQERFILEGKLIVPGERVELLNHDRNVSFVVTITQPDGHRVDYLGDVWNMEDVRAEVRGFGTYRVCIRSNAHRKASIREELFFHAMTDSGEVVQSAEFLAKETGRQVFSGPHDLKGSRPSNESLVGGKPGDGVDKPSSLWDKTHGHDHDGAPRTGSGALATKTHGKTAVAFADLIWKRLDRVHNDIVGINVRLERHSQTLLSNQYRANLWGYTELLIFAGTAVLNILTLRWMFSGKERHGRFEGLGGAFEL